MATKTKTEAERADAQVNLEYAQGLWMEACERRAKCERAIAMKTRWLFRAHLGKPGDGSLQEHIDQLRALEDELAGLQRDVTKAYGDVQAARREYREAARAALEAKGGAR